MRQVYLRISFRDEIVQRSRESHKHGLLVCARCGFAWLTEETAGADDMDFVVICDDQNECFRRRRDRVGPPSPEWDFQEPKTEKRRRRKAK